MSSCKFVDWTCSYLLSPVDCLFLHIYNIHVHTHMHTCTHTHMHTYTHTHIHINTFTHAHIHTCTHAHAHTHMHTHMHTYIHAHMHTCTHTHKHIHTCVLDPFIQTGLRELPVAVELISCQNPNIFKDDINMRDRWTIGQR